ncbi:MAG: hypothetical protein ACHP7P_11260 [Terriglobales bacterium]
MPKTKKTPKPKKAKATATHESTAYLQGLAQEFIEQVSKYNHITGELLSLEARIELAEKTMCLTRDHFANTIKNTEGATPKAWDALLESVRFVGVRLADACASVLQVHKKLTPDQLMHELNAGMFRFRTNAPLREIHAALLRHPHVEKKGGVYEWIAPAEQQIRMRLRVLERPTTPGVNPQQGIALNTAERRAGS